MEKKPDSRISPLSVSTATPVGCESSAKVNVIADSGYFLSFDHNVDIDIGCKSLAQVNVIADSGYFLSFDLNVDVNIGCKSSAQVNVIADSGYFLSFDPDVYVSVGCKLFAKKENSEQTRAHARETLWGCAARIAPIGDFPPVHLKKKETLQTSATL